VKNEKTHFGFDCDDNPLRRMFVAPLGMYAPQSNATGLGDLTLGLWASHQSLNVNQPITIRFTVRNDGKQTVVYDRKDKPVMDILAGNPPVQWSDGKPLTSEITRLELKPGESKVIEMTWKPGVEYDRKVTHISGLVWWCAEDKPCYNEVGLTITVGFTFSPLP
jgi:hypothetical protein